ncbi:glycoside hydrolase family 53 protein [Pseudocercospora fijiensis CIRAD86]|uniref:Arabinogalactan endo-beta-1,4-galactanase n=1 Tax=Pseudocercospora fijiensis (strain CIRAD86) TaxID=383855 RepID=M3B4T3_PSEFD|nr:glycoside hydrolase family 53 protein [Pseudocercospora fijiensis CIRAD86]EME84383.1 glycoside hydrolase family 53 protein [Pseudocercospora fijiensis CIRAD86]
MIIPITSALIVLASRIANAALTYKGVDWSSLLVEEGAGKTYKNTAGSTQPLETVLKASGVNAVRQRLWNSPSNGNYNLDYNLKLAKRAKAAGLDIYLDFHFSDSWADPSHQTTPSAWSNYDIDDLTYAVYNYTLATMNTFRTSSISLSLVSIGNEITAGMLWPLGSTQTSTYNLARLLHSASAGIKDSTISPKPQILIHLDNGWNYDTQESWYDTVLGEGPLKSEDYDVQGVSYYPFYNSAATLASLKSSLSKMKNKYRKEVMVVETNWPQSCPNPRYSFPSDTTSIPFSAAGQTTWMKDVASVVSGAGGNGLFYWEPAWLDNAGLGSSCNDNLMFDSTGKALSSLAVFASL